MLKKPKFNNNLVRSGGEKRNIWAHINEKSRIGPAGSRCDWILGLSDAVKVSSPSPSSASSQQFSRDGWRRLLPVLVSHDA